MAKPTKQTTLNDYPEYVAALDKLNDLKHERDRLGSDIQDAQDRRGAVLTGSARIASQAAAMLEGDGGVATAADTATSLEAVDALRQRHTVVLRAIEMQKQRITDIQSRISREIAEAALPEYRALLRDLAEVLQPACALAAKEAAIRQHFTDQHITFAGTLRPCPFPALRLDEYQSKVNVWLDDIARDHGITVKVARKVSP